MPKPKTVWNTNRGDTTVETTVTSSILLEGGGLLLTEVGDSLLIEPKRVVLKSHTGWQSESKSRTNWQAPSGHSTAVYSGPVTRKTTGGSARVTPQGSTRVTSGVVYTNKSLTEWADG